MEGSQAVVRGRVLESMHDILDAGSDDVSGRGEGHGSCMGKPGDSVTDAFALGAPDPTIVASVGVKGRANIPSIQGMGGPGVAFARLEMGQDLDARGSNGSAVKIKMAVDLCPSRELGIDARATQQVQGQ